MERANSDRRSARSSLDGQPIAAEVFRPAFAFFGQKFEQGLEFEFADGRLISVRASSRAPQPFLLSPAFVNAHSHLEYRALQGAIAEADYWRWIRRLTVLKKTEDLSEVERMSRKAAEENRRAGVAIIGEHIDRVEAAAGLQQAGLGGVAFAELITISEAEQIEWKLQKVRASASLIEQQWGQPVYVSPHAAFTVHEEVLHRFANEPGFKSIHVAETPAERLWVREDRGHIADFRRSFGLVTLRQAKSVVQYLLDMGYGKEPVQFVHLCDADETDIEAISRAMVSVAHCPRSNQRLGCPPAPILELLEAGVNVGIGLDSPASSGPIDMLAEIRCAFETSRQRNRSISFTNLWKCATVMGAQSLGIEGWGLTEDTEHHPPCIRISLPDPHDPASALKPNASIEWI